MPEVIIIGGGFSGLCMAIQLKRKLGMQDFLLFERSSVLGGVWANHTYPGVKCDIPTALYSLSFGQRYWRDLFSKGRTIQGYLQDLASHYHILESNTVFLSEVIAATWNETSKRWTVRVMDKSPQAFGRTTECTCKILISAVGNMSVPNELSLPGRDFFEGTIVHSGAYQPNVSLKDKNVVVIGSGCSAQQIVGAIAPHVKTLAIFAPTKQWMLPRPTLPLPWLFDALSKYTSFGKSILRLAIFAVAESSQRGMHWDCERDLRDSLENASREYINKVAPARYRDQLIPTYSYGARRPVFDVNYLDTLHRPNVELYTEHAQACTATHILRQDGQAIPADIIIAATGFKAQSFLKPMVIKGQQGLDLQTHMTRHGGVTCYKGSFYSCFPNFATIYGPNSGTAHSSAVFMIECQVNMVLKRLIKPVLQEEDVNSVVIKPEKETKWMLWLRQELSNTVWEKCKVGWYTDEQGFCTANYPRSQLHFWWSTLITPSHDFLHDPRDYIKSTYGTMKEFESFASLICIYFFGAFLMLAMLQKESSILSPSWRF